MNVVVTEERPNPVVRLSNSTAAFPPALSKACSLLRRCRESSKLLIASRASGLDVDCGTNDMEGIKRFLRVQLIHTACCMCYTSEALESA